MDFRTRLLSTLRSIEPVLREPGVLVAGSEVPNLLEPDALCTLVVSQDLDIAVPVESHAGVKARLREVRGLKRSEEEPSVWLPLDPQLIEVDFIGMDTRSERAGETYLLEDRELPLLVFARLSLLRPGKPLNIEGLEVPVPRPAGLLLVCEPADMKELESLYRRLPEELRYGTAGKYGAGAMTGKLREHVRRMREADLIRGWEYRQRNLAKGVWYRFRRVLMDAGQVWVIGDSDADLLQRDGYVPHPVGYELAPAKRLFLLPASKLWAIPSRRQVPVRLCSELLQAHNLILLAHGEASSPSA